MERIKDVILMLKLLKAAWNIYHAMKNIPVVGKSLGLLHAEVLVKTALNKELRSVMSKEPAVDELN